MGGLSRRNEPSAARGPPTGSCRLCNIVRLTKGANRIEIIISRHRLRFAAKDLHEPITAQIVAKRDGVHRGITRRDWTLGGVCPHVSGSCCPRGRQQGARGASGSEALVLASAGIRFQYATGGRQER